MITSGPTTAGGSAPAGGLPTYRRATSPFTPGQLAVTRSQTYYNGNFAYAAAQTSRQPFTVGPAGVADLRSCFGNWSAFPPDGGIGAGATVKGALEWGASFFPLYFNGRRILTLDGDTNAGGTVWSEPIGQEIPAGAAIFIRTLYTVASGAACPLSNFPGGTWVAGDSVDATGALANNIGAGYLYGACGLAGTPASRVPQVALIGDSRIMGFGDPTGRGYANQALGNNFVSINCGALGETVAEYLGNGHYLRDKFLAGCDYAFEAYGINDLAAAATALQLETNRLAVWNLAAQRGLTVYADTLWPETTGTWTSIGGQTKATWDAQRVLVNQWIRARAPILAGAPVAPGTSGATLAGQTGHPLTGVTDSSTLIETAQDSGFWNWNPVGPAAWTADGIHANAAGITAALPAVPVSKFV
jgi:hypothetical protein